MKILIVTFIISYLICLIGKMEINGKKETNLLRKVPLSLFVAFILTIFIGLPILLLINLIF